MTYTKEWAWRGFIYSRSCLGHESWQGWHPRPFIHWGPDRANVAMKVRANVALARIVRKIEMEWDSRWSCGSSRPKRVHERKLLEWRWRCRRPHASRTSNPRHQRFCLSTPIFLLKIACCSSLLITTDLSNLVAILGSKYSILQFSQLLDFNPRLEFREQGCVGK